MSKDDKLFIKRFEWECCTDEFRLCSMACLASLCLEGNPGLLGLEGLRVRGCDPTPFRRRALGSTMAAACVYH